MLQLLREDESREVSFITFTRTSRRDTESRLVDAFGDSSTEKRPGILPRASTLHTLAKSLVHRYAAHIGRSADFSMLIDKKGEKALVLEDLSFDLGVNVEINVLSDDLSNFRSTEGWSTNTSLPRDFRSSVIEYYEKLLTFYNTLDMEGVVAEACVVMSAVAEQLPPIFLQVDEYQDLNPVDQKLVRLVASNSLSQVIVVGDDAQSIYGFRYANYIGIRDLWMSDDWEHVSFPDCQRLPSHVLNAALDLISKRDYLGAQVNRKPDNGKRIPVFQCTTSPLQVVALARDIFLEIAATEGSELPVTYRDFLVLCPTSKFVENIVTELVENHGIPAHKPVSLPIPDELWQLILVLRILDNNDPLAIRQVLPNLGLNVLEIHDLRKTAISGSLPFYEHCLTAIGSRFIEYHERLEMVRSAGGNAHSFLKALASVPGLPREERLAELFKPFIASTNDPLRPYRWLIQNFYKAFGLQDPGEQVGEENSVLVATLHSAKGLEARRVYCLWMNSRFMPADGEDVEEQRRLLYVAMTRAKEELKFFFHEVYDPSSERRKKESAMSPFLAEIRSHLEIRRLKAANLK